MNLTLHSERSMVSLAPTSNIRYMKSASRYYLVRVAGSESEGIE